MQKLITIKPIAEAAAIVTALIMSMTMPLSNADPTPVRPVPATLTPTLTATLPATATPIATATSVAGALATSTVTVVPSATATTRATGAATVTATPTVAATLTPTPLPTSTPTSAPGSTPTVTPIPNMAGVQLQLQLLALSPLPSNRQIGGQRYRFIIWVRNTSFSPFGNYIVRILLPNDVTVDPATIVPPNGRVDGQLRTTQAAQSRTVVWPGSQLAATNGVFEGYFDLIMPANSVSGSAPQFAATIQTDNSQVQLASEVLTLGACVNTGCAFLPLAMKQLRLSP